MQPLQVAVWIMGRIRAGVTIRQRWRYYSVGVVVCTSFELIPIHYGWWKYYGDNQGLRILGFPMWWWFANPMSLFAMATLFHFLRQRVLSGRLSPLLVVLWPMALFATHGSVAIPVFPALKGYGQRQADTRNGQGGNEATGGKASQQGQRTGTRRSVRGHE